MKIKNFRLFAGGVIAFLIIGTLRTCEESKIRQERKAREIFNHTIEEIKFEDVFIPAEDKKLEDLLEKIEEKCR